MNRELVSNRVFDYRTKSGFTQEVLADKLGVSRQTVIAIERGNYVPSVLLALKIAAVFKEPVEKLFKLL